MTRGQENERGRLRRLIRRMRALTASVEQRNQRIWGRGGYPSGGKKAEEMAPPPEDMMERRQW